MNNVVSLDAVREDKEVFAFYDKIRDQIPGRYNNYLLILESDEGIGYSHAGSDRKGVDLVAKYIQAKEKAGVITTDEFLAKLLEALKGGAAQ